jgi:hypothetical protein
VDGYATRSDESQHIKGLASTMLGFIGNRSQWRAKTETKVAFTSLKDKMITNTNIQGNSNGTNNANYNKGPMPNQGGSSQAYESLKQNKNKSYSFRRDKVAQIFRGTLKNDLSLPTNKRPKDADKSDEPNFCPYHRILGHTIEDW